MMRSNLILAALMLALVGSFAACSRGSAANTQAAGAPPPPVVVVEKVETRDLVEHAELTGRLGAIESVEVRPRVSGHLLEVRFQSGEIVEKDQLLFSIDPRVHGQITAWLAGTEVGRPTLRSSDQPRIDVLAVPEDGEPEEP